MDVRKIKKLIELIEESNIAELEIHEGEESVRIARYTATPAPAAVAAPVMLETPPPEITEAAMDTITGHTVNAPMVGTFYRSSSPESQPFVDIGTRVQKGDTLCLIEAMKILNQIEADKDGIISRILIDNAQPVEYNQPLFVVD